MSQQVAMRKQGAKTFTVNSIKSIPVGLKNPTVLKNRFAAPAMKDAKSLAIKTATGGLGDLAGASEALKHTVSTADSIKDNANAAKDTIKAKNIQNKVVHAAAGAAANIIPLGNTMKAGLSHGIQNNVDKESLDQIKRIKDKHTNPMSSRRFIASLKEREICRRTPALCKV